MPKSSLPFNPAEYALVASRITLFYERFPNGRIVTDLIARDRDVVFKASVYRSSADIDPAATGWASEREGDGEVNEVACLENTETSAIGRALANLGFTASIRRPSREEMEKAARTRSRNYGTPDKSHDSERVAEQSQSYAVKVMNVQAAETAARERATDVMALVLEAGNRGMPAEYLGALQQRILDRNATPDELTSIERRVRHWILNRARPAANSGGDSPSGAPPVNSLDQ